MFKEATGILVVTAGLICLQSNDACATQLNWYKDVQAAVQEASRSKKPMLVEFTAEWCGYCRKMKKTYSDDRVASHVQNCFVPLSVDADEERNFAQTVGIKGLPTTVIISPEFKVIKKITGYRTPRQLNDELGTICPPHHRASEPRTPVQQAAQQSHSQAKSAFGRYCPVTLLEDQLLYECTDLDSTVYAGQTVFFATAEHKRRFEQEPAKYWPVLDGNCIVHAVEQGEMATGRPEWGAVYRGRLWFFSDADHRARFADAPDIYLRR